MRGSLFHLPHHGGQPRAQRLKGDAEAEAQEERKDEGYRGAVHQRERNIRQFLGDEQADAKGRGHAGHGHEDIDDDAEPKMGTQMSISGMAGIKQPSRLMHTMMANMTAMGGMFMEAMTPARIMGILLMVMK